MPRKVQNIPAKALSLPGRYRRWNDAAHIRYLPLHGHCSPVTIDSNSNESKGARQPDRDSTDDRQDGLEQTLRNLADALEITGGDSAATAKDISLSERNKKQESFEDALVARTKTAFSGLLPASVLLADLIELAEKQSPQQSSRAKGVGSDSGAGALTATGQSNKAEAAHFGKAETSQLSKTETPQPANAESTQSPNAEPGTPTKAALERFLSSLPPVTSAESPRGKDRVPDMRGPDDKAPSGESNEAWRAFRMQFDGADIRIPTAGNKLIIGRNPAKADICFSEVGLSREHCSLEMRDGKVYVTDLGSTNGTSIMRGGRSPELVTRETELRPGDTLVVGKLQLKWTKPGTPEEKFRPAGYKADEVEGARDATDGAAWDKADPAASKASREASNDFIKRHQFSDRLPDGFQAIGGVGNRIGLDGRHGDKVRFSTVVDTRPGKDPELESFLSDVKKDLGHLKDKPEELARELAKRVREAMQPKGWGERELDAAFDRMRAENPGARLLLGDFIGAAKRGEACGLCTQQSMLLKVAFDSFYAEGETRPKMTLVSGFHGENPAALSPSETLNHAWTTLEVAGQQKIFDPRMEVYGDLAASRPMHQPGMAVDRLRVPAKAADAEKAVPIDVEELKGKEVRFNEFYGRIKDITDGDVKILIGGSKEVPLASLKALNDPDDANFEPQVGEQYKVRRTAGQTEDGWTVRGWKDPVKKDVLILTKSEAVEKTVPLETIRAQNPHLFEPESVDPGASMHMSVRVNKANPLDFGFVHGRQVQHDFGDWFVQGVTADGKIEITRPSEQTLTPEVFKKLNGETTPKVGDNVWAPRATGEREKWKVIDVDEATGNVRVRNEHAYREVVRLDRLLRENPDMERRHSRADIRRILNDPRTKIDVICRWTDGNSGHDKYIGQARGIGGEVIRVMIDKPWAREQQNWTRLKNDLAAQTLARKMGDDARFPETVERQGVVFNRGDAPSRALVQEFVGQEGGQLHLYLRHLSHQEPEWKSERMLDRRIEKMLASNKCDPNLRAELARATAFSVLLGDDDQHGLNYVFEKTGPKPGDIRIARIDTDYAFGVDQTPIMDRQPNYGDAMNGVYGYFSGKKLPADVRANIKKISDELNSGDSKAQNEARDAYAAESGLSRARVDALAARAKTMSDTGRFPVSRNWRDVQRNYHGESIICGRNDLLGDDMKAGKPELDIDKAAKNLEKRGFSQDRIDALKEAYRNLSLLNGNEQARQALNALGDISTDGVKMSDRKAEALADLIVAKSQNPGLPVKFDVLRSADENVVVEARDLLAGRKIRNHEEAAGLALDRTARGADRAVDTNPSKTNEGGSTKYSMGRVEIKMKNKTLAFDGVELVAGKLYLRSAEDGTRYSAEPWLDMVKSSLISRSKGEGPEAEAAGRALKAFNASTDAKVAVLQLLTKNLAESTKDLSPAETVTGSKGASMDAQPTLDRGRARTGAATRLTAPTVASGTGEIRDTKGGGFEIGTGSAAVGSSALARPEDLTREQIDKMREEIKNDESTTAEQKSRALEVLKAAENPANREAREVLRRAQLEGRRGGLAAGVEGHAAGIAIVCLTLAGWYAYYKTSNVQDSYIPAAKVN